MLETLVKPVETLVKPGETLVKPGEPAKLTEPLQPDEPLRTLGTYTTFLLN